jgi:hypothetical protein
MEYTHDRIVAFQGSWGSGLATLVLEHGQVFADNGGLGRALIRAFGAGGQGHTIDNAALQGQGIYYWRDEMGLCIAGFIPEGEWTAEPFPLGETREVDAALV